MRLRIKISKTPGGFLTVPVEKTRMKETYLKREKWARSFIYWTIAALILTVLLLGLFGWSPAAVHADAPPAMAELALPDSATLPDNNLLPLAFQEPNVPDHPATDLACVSCHSDTTAEIEFPSGETLPVQVDLQLLAASAHGLQADDPLACTDCHQTINDYQYPHTPVENADLRDYEVERGQLCERCHAQPHVTSHPGQDAALPVTCTDCHGSHDVHTVEAWDTEDAVAACVNCHKQAEVASADAEQLIPLIRSGLFADEADSAYCLACHSQPGITMAFPNGDEISITVDEDAFHASVHGESNSWDALVCNDCHKDYIFPHEEQTIETAREFTIMQNQVCEDCHEPFFEKALDSVHGAALLEGNLDAAVCTDCHGAHDTPIPNEPRTAISETCAQCHSTIFEEYAESVHGAALIEDENVDVPTCIECHGVHDIHSPTTALARARSPELCANCHTNAEIMDKYDISTQVFDTYVSDFHGTTVMLFDYEHEDVPPNTAVCYDCHGVHNIKSPDDPHADINTNLVEACRQCHPDAKPNFADSWLGHYTPSLEKFPIIFLVDLFYAIVIPITLGFFFFMIATDIYRRIRQRIRKNEA